jgi:hypothetical protein
MTDAERKLALRRTYGRGYYDGLRAASVATNSEASLNAAKLEMRERNLTGVCRTARAARPPAPATSSATAVAQALREMGVNYAPNVIEGCLESLRQDGLLKEPKPSVFVRVAARTAVASAPTERGAPSNSGTEPAHPQPPTPEMAAPTAGLAGPACALDRLGSVAKSARALSGKLIELADEIETAALEAEERIQRVQADTAKLRQLQELLKSLGDTSL